MDGQAARIILLDHDGRISVASSINGIADTVAIMYVEETIDTSANRFVADDPARRGIGIGTCWETCQRTTCEA